MYQNPNLRHSLNIDGEFNSPLAQGRIDKGYDNLVIKLLHYPKFDDFVRTAIFAEYASSGGGKGMPPIDRLEELYDPSLLVELSNSFMHGGLEQFLEADTVTFLVYGCSRGFTHEFVRTRKAWFIQQTMRHSYMGDANIRMPLYISQQPENIQKLWVDTVKTSVRTYQTLSEQHDAPYQDARTVLPIGIETWILGGMPIRAFLEVYAYRACLSGDTIVHTVGGDKTIMQLFLSPEENFYVYSVDEKQKLRVGKASRPVKTGHKKLLKITFDTGDVLRVTEDHLIMLRDGQYKKACQIAINDSVMPFNRDYINGYPIVYRDIDSSPIAAHKFVMNDLYDFVTYPYQYGDTRQMVWHHKNFIKEDCRPENLQLMSSVAHIQLHASLGRPLSEMEKNAISKRMRLNNPMRNPEIAKKNGMAKRGRKNQLQGIRMMGNSYATGKGTTDGGKIGGTVGHLVSQKSLDSLDLLHQMPWNKGLSKETDSRLENMGNRSNHNHKVISIEFDGYEDVYDLAVEKYHNFAANGVFVHNCTMFYPEMQWIFREMGKQLSEACPWLADKIKISCEVPNANGEHFCTYRGTEPVEGYCEFPWAKEDNRLFKSKLYSK